MKPSWFPLPNIALRQVRAVANYTQAELAQRLGVSKPFIQALEQGTRRASKPLALKSMAIFGVWYESVLNHWTEAVDLYGRPYTTESWESYIEGQKEELLEPEMAQYLLPIRDLFEAAAVTGKVRVLSLLLFEYTKELLNINGIGGGLQQVHSERVTRATEFTFAHLRANPTLALALSFEDDQSRSDNEIAYRAQAIPKSQPSLFPAIYPRQEQIREAYVARLSEGDLQILAYRLAQESKIETEDLVNSGALIDTKKVGDISRTQKRADRKTVLRQLEANATGSVK